MSWFAGRRRAWRPAPWSVRIPPRSWRRSPTPRSRSWRRRVSERRFRIWRGDARGGQFVDYTVEVDPGMVVLDVIHRIQALQANDLAVRWNCKAGKCGSCSMEINGRPRLACMTRMNQFASGEMLSVQPMKTFPVIKDLVTDVSWNYEQNRRIP